MKLIYRLADEKIPPPQTGHVYLYRSLSPNAGYVNNSTAERFMIGLSLDIPDGVTVELSPVDALEERGLYLRRRKFVGPMVLDNIAVSIHNLGNTTVMIEPMAPLAVIEAYQSRKAVSWQTDVAVEAA